MNSSVLVNGTTAEEFNEFVYVVPVTEVSYLRLFDFESVEINRHRLWMGENWHVSIYASLLYISFIYFGGLLMKNRQPFQLRGLLTAWNIGLAAFSALGFLRTAPEVFHVLKQENGFHHSVCSR